MPILNQEKINCIRQSILGLLDLLNIQEAFTPKPQTCCVCGALCCAYAEDTKIPPWESSYGVASKLGVQSHLDIEYLARCPWGSIGRCERNHSFTLMS